MGAVGGEEKNVWQKYLVKADDTSQLLKFRTPEKPKINNNNKKDI